MGRKDFYEETQVNYVEYGTIKDFDKLKSIVIDEDLSRSSMREQVEAQKNTRCAIGVYEILDGVNGFGDIGLYEKYIDTCVTEVCLKVMRYHGYSGVKVLSFIIVMLKANSEISEHIDEYGKYDKAHRIHIPIITNKDCMFCVGGESRHLYAGSIIEINNVVPHSVINNGDDRIHIVIDIEAIDTQEIDYNFISASNNILDQFYLKG